MDTQIYDISPRLSASTAVFPGDTPCQQKTVLSFQQGHHLMLSSIASTVHLGAHADAPCHYHPQGTDIAERPLRYYLGRCQVISVNQSTFGRIYPEDLSGHSILAPRILLRTNSYPNADEWREDFSSLSPELVDWLAHRGVITIGIDTPSVDPHDSKALESHQALFLHDVAVLEGLDLSAVPDGTYTLIALPLRLVGFDASPVRAILVPQGVLPD
jgi:arylformamidase